MVLIERRNRDVLAGKPLQLRLHQSDRHAGEDAAVHSGDDRLRQRIIGMSALNKGWNAGRAHLPDIERACR